MKCDHKEVKVTGTQKYEPQPVRGNEVITVEVICLNCKELFRGQLQKL